MKLVAAGPERPRGQAAETGAPGAERPARPQGGRWDIDVSADPTQATVGDLARALQVAPSGTGDRNTGLMVDGLWAPGDLSLFEAGVHEGAEVRLDGGSPAPPPATGLVEVAVVAGLDAGARCQLGAGTHLVGRAAEAAVVLADITVSRQHCVLDVSADGSVRIWDRSSSGTFVDGRPITEPTLLPPDAVVETGAVAWVVRPPTEGDRLSGTDRFRDLTPTGLINLNRPPRFAPPAGPPRLSPPKAPSSVGSAPFSLVAILAPAVMGAVMVFALKNVAYLAFAGLSPLMALGNWWESKHRSRRALRSDTRRYAADLDAFSAELSQAHAQATTLRRARTPDVAEVLRRAATPSAHLWERRLGHGDFGALSAGIGDVRWTPDLPHAAGEAVPHEVMERLARYGTLISVPLPVELAEGGVVGVVGDRAAALAVARSLLVQAAVHHGPADMRIAVTVLGAGGHGDGSGAAGAWDWAKWLPHTRDHRPGPANRRLLTATAPEAVRLLEGLIASRSPEQPGSGKAPQAPITLLVVDGEELLAGRISPARAVLRGDAGPSAGIVVASTPDRLPSLCTAIVTVDASGAARLSEPRRGVRDQDLLACGIGEAEARECARVLARYEDPELMLDGAVLPELVPLLQVLDMPAPDASVVAERWAGQDGFHLRAPIGLAARGAFWLELDRHGPHGLIGGTTGSGKSELLKTLVAALAASYPPSELTFGLFDFKGGSTFVEFADLPHTVGMASDLDVSLARRALQCLRAELAVPGAGI